MPTDDLCDSCGRNYAEPDHRNCKECGLWCYYCNGTTGSMTTDVCERCEDSIIARCGCLLPDGRPMEYDIDSFMGDPFLRTIVNGPPIEVKQCPNCNQVMLVVNEKALKAMEQFYSRVFTSMIADVRK